LENVAWGVIQKAHLSDNLSAKFTSVIAASLQNDAYSVETLKRSLKDTNSLLRQASLHFCLRFGDEMLKEEILRLLKEEKVFEVRKKVIEVAQRFKIEEARPILESLLNDEQVSYEERSLVVTALIHYYDSIDKEKLQKLAKSSLVGHRMLACALFSHFDLKNETLLLKDLAFDLNKQVRLFALSSLGVLKITTIDGTKLEEHLKEALEDPNPQISLMASWALLESNPSLCRERLRHFLLHTDQNIRLQAAGLIGYSLPYTESLAEEMFTFHPDIYVRANLSFYLVAHRKQIKEASDQLYSLFQSKEMFMFKQIYPAHLNILAPSRLVLEQGNPNAFYQVSSMYYQLAQLELLNILALLKDPRAKEAISIFLDHHHSDVSTLSLRSLLQLEDHHSLELMKEFLNHKDKHKRVEAALVLALFKRDKEALKVLEETYNEVNRDLKQMILMAIGEIASKDSIPFLMDKVYESSQSLRINASSALIQCLRH
jgi:HEAT repeat protein